MLPFVGSSAADGDGCEFTDSVLMDVDRFGVVDHGVVDHGVVDRGVVVLVVDVVVDVVVVVTAVSAEIQKLRGRFPYNFGFNLSKSWLVEYRRRKKYPCQFFSQKTFKEKILKFTYTAMLKDEK